MHFILSESNLLKASAQIACSSNEQVVVELGSGSESESTIQ